MRNVFIALALVAAVSLGLYYYGKHEGGAAEKVKQEKAVIKVTQKLRKSDAKIKNNAPGDADRAAGIDFLLKHVRQ